MTQDAIKLIISGSTGKMGHSLKDTLENKKDHKFFKTLEIDKTVFNYARLETNKKKAPTKMKKWSCGCTNVRCAVILEAYCEKCGSSFGLED